MRLRFRDRDSRYLLSVMARSLHCGSPMTNDFQVYHRQKRTFHGCSYYKTRGSSICKNSLLVEREVLDHIVLKSIQEALTDWGIKVAVDKALAKTSSGRRD